jgi:3-hydroxyisobutyrate dehydrogenase-like beta-hydroxyacid dehydrogenase
MAGFAIAQSDCARVAEAMPPLTPAAAAAHNARAERPDRPGKEESAAMSEPAPPVGLVGVGLMGEALAVRLIGAGVRVTGFDIDPAGTARLAGLGGEAAASLSDLARRCDPIVLALFDTAQVEAVVEEGLLPTLGEASGKLLICVSTCDPSRIAALAARIAGHGLGFLEAPVSGTSGQVRRGEGVGLIGGDRAAAARVAPLLEAMFPISFHVGGVGDGNRAKLAVNLILGLNRLALAEGLVCAERLGLDPATFLAVARGSAAWSQVMDTKGAKMVARDFAPEGRVRQTLKDARLMLEAVAAAGQALPLLQVHAEVLEACVKAGEGDRDNSIVIEEIRRRRMSG